MLESQSCVTLQEVAFRIVHARSSSIERHVARFGARRFELPGGFVYRATAVEDGKLLDAQVGTSLRLQ